MTSDELRGILRDRDVPFHEKPVQNGTRFDCKTGEIFNVFNTGKMSFQGKQSTALAKDIRAQYEGAVEAPALAEPQIIPAAAAPLMRQSL
jgi:hypothetical protein